MAVQWKRPALYGLILLFIFPASSAAQRFSPAVWDCAVERWMVSFGGLYLQFDQQLDDFDLRGTIPVLDIAVSPFRGLIVMGGAGFGKVRLERSPTGSLALRRKYPVDAGMVLGPFFLTGRWLSFSAFAWVQRLDYRGSQSMPHPIGDLEWVRTRDYLYRAYLGSTGFLLHIDFWRVSFYGGPTISRYYQKLELQETLSDGSQTVPFSQTMLEEMSSWYAGYMVGAGLRLPQRFSLSVQISRNQAGQTQIFLSLAQTGSP